MILGGIFAAENLDSTAEKISVSGCDISSFKDSTAPVNYEHQHGDEKDIVGRVLTAKKIFSAADCENELERRAWDSIKMPLVWGYVRLADCAGHEGAKALAAHIRDHVASDEKVLIRFSIEGSTTKRSGNLLEESVARALALTWKPANRICNTTLIEDPGAPEGFSKTPTEKPKDLLSDVASKSEDPFCHLLGGSVEVTCNPIIDDTDLTKALDAGSGDVRPSSLTQGAALQRESMGTRRKKMVSVLGNYFATRDKDLDKAELKELLRHELPELGDSYVEHFVDALDHVQIPRNHLKKHDLNSLVKAQSLEVELRKHVSDLSNNFLLSDPRVPTVYALYGDMDGLPRRMGRFLSVGNYLHHLEDYFGFLSQFLPEGPVRYDTIATIAAMSKNPNLHLAIESHCPLPGAPSDTTTDPIEGQGVEASYDDGPLETPTLAPVFHYTRAGHDGPHVLEILGDQCLLDGNPIPPDEVAAILANIGGGAATLRYRLDPMAKMEDFLEDLFKNDDDDYKPGAAQDALAHVRRAVKAGLIPASAERDLTHHLYNDPVTNLGNRKAWEELKEKKKPGVYTIGDLNHLKHINDTYGHTAGDNAIKAYAGAVKRAIKDSGNSGHIKASRFGGDEFGFHAPSMEHASKFARKLNEHLEAVPPIGGVHRLSTSLGFGVDPESADKALYAAKAQRYHPGQEGVGDREKKTRFEVGKEPNFAHSHIPGSEGPIPLHNPSAAALQETGVKAPEPSAVPKIEAPKPPA